MVFKHAGSDSAPSGVIYAFADMESPEDRMLTSFCDENITVRVPPVWGGR